MEDIKKEDAAIIEVENRVIAAILNRFDLMLDALDVISSEDFYNNKNHYIFDILNEVFEESKKADFDFLVWTLKNRKVWNTAWEQHLQNIRRLGDQSTDKDIISGYISEVQKKSSLRKLVSAGDKIRNIGLRERRSASRAIEMAEDEFIKSISGKELGKIYSLEEIAPAVDRDVENMEMGKLTGLSTGLRTLDGVLGGLQRGDLIILAGRPGQGKTALALNIAYNVAKSGHPVLFFSLEMTKEQLVKRIICNEGKIDGGKMLRGNLSDDEKKVIKKTIHNIEKYPLYVNEGSGGTPSEVAAKIKKGIIQHKIELVVIDYLQLMEAPGAENRMQEISAISRKLKGLAKDEKIHLPIIALSQLSREIEKRKDGIPLLSDLRESGSLEQDSDIVMFIYRDECYNEDTEKQNIAEIFIKKHRHAGEGKVDLFFDKKYNRFSDLEFFRLEENDPQNQPK